MERRRDGKLPTVIYHSVELETIAVRSDSCRRCLIARRRSIDHSNGLS